MKISMKTKPAIFGFLQVFFFAPFFADKLQIGLHHSVLKAIISVFFACYNRRMFILWFLYYEPHLL